MMLWVMAQDKLGSQKALFSAFGNAFNFSMHPPLANIWWNANIIAYTLEQILQAQPIPIPKLTGKPRSMQYIMKNSEMGSGNDDEAEEELWEDDEDSPIEHDLLHPTNVPEDPNEDHERFEPMSTKAAQGVYAIHFASPGCSDSSSMSAAVQTTYPMQILVRVDPARLMLTYDVIDFYPQFAHNFLPITERKLQRAQNFMLGFPLRHEDSESEEEDEEELEEAVELQKKEELRCFFESSLCTYSLDGRVFRCQFPLDNVTGIALKYAVKPPHPNSAAAPDDPNAAVLVLELRRPVAPEGFAVRGIMPNGELDMEFVTVADWTPEARASSATRHYIRGELEELVELCNYLMNICPAIKAMLETPPPSAGVTNTLASAGVSLLPNAAPPVEDCTAAASESGTADAGESSDATSTQWVYDVLIAAGVDEERVKRVNPCLLAGIQRRHIVIDHTSSEPLKQPHVVASSIFLEAASRGGIKHLS
ncbi:hypothetical protein CYMTET_22765 [Cymbomonas tetramitiformis]|uniref:Uncharacterized protein n=1 Tax=Cymbomonas tetramitiformis TaxID=36881 RepID=A0AAE0FZT9_9CHLO|nr:hypothetical protein CYMTET_22765 [Cymbomonas tetramitiformis]